VQVAGPVQPLWTTSSKSDKLLQPHCHTVAAAAMLPCTLVGLVAFLLERCCFTCAFATRFANLISLAPEVQVARPVQALAADAAERILAGQHQVGQLLKRVQRSTSSQPHLDGCTRSGRRSRGQQRAAPSHTQEANNLLEGNSRSAGPACHCRCTSKHSSRRPEHCCCDVLIRSAAAGTSAACPAVFLAAAAAPLPSHL
jgi:transcriptional regulator of acetoin/glycerol metabolism